MPRTKKENADATAKAAHRLRTTSQDIAIEERLAACGRGEADSIVYVGELVERTLKGEFGAIIKALTTGRISRELGEARGSGVSSDRVLGRIEMAENSWNDFEQFVHDKDAALKPATKESAPVMMYNYTPD